LVFAFLVVFWLNYLLCFFLPFFREEGGGPRGTI
jgi:hypothetical protein